jgi:S1-C subfamily serine protease
MPKFTPPDRPKLTKWQYWLVRAVPILGIASLTLFVLPGLLTQPQMVKESSEQQQQRLRQQMRSISIRILANGESIGTGVLLDKQERVYTVVTNAHVIQAASAPFNIQTPDGQVYAAALIPPPSKQNRDLSMLRFQSDRIYTPTKLATVSPKIGTLVWAAGFPFDENTTTPANSQNIPARVSGLTIADGKVAQILPVAITGGYQIGSDNAVRKGMSGGPLVDAEGNLVGINGIHANPLWDVAETLEDGTKVDAKLQEKIDSCSWAIPIDFIENYSSQ